MPGLRLGQPYRPRRLGRDLRTGTAAPAQGPCRTAPPRRLNDLPHPSPSAGAPPGAPARRGPAGPGPAPAPADPSTLRSALRHAGRRARRELTGDERLRAEERLQHHLLGLLADLPVGTVALSVATDGEPDLSAIVGTLRERGWRLVLPVVQAQGQMSFALWEPGSALAPDRYGIPTPVGATPVATDELDVVVVPCVAVDLEGNRLGFGAGYYDRALSGLRPDALTVAAVFSCQVAEAVPVDDWDVRLDAVVTDGGNLRSGAAGSGRA
ncbi:MAG: 5-formyltetrahydrofolate cyclo-ligase [Microthrixaceae bacterium]